MKTQAYEQQIVEARQLITGIVADHSRTLLAPGAPPTLAMEMRDRMAKRFGVSTTIAGAAMKLNTDRGHWTFKPSFGKRPSTVEAAQAQPVPASPE